MRTGVKDMTDLCMTDRELPGRLSELAGIEVIDYDCLMDERVMVEYGGKKLAAAVWADVIRKSAAGVKVCGNFADGFCQGEPCITQNAYGKGCCYYVGTEPQEELMSDFIGDAVREAGVNSLGTADDGVELAVRDNGSCSWLFVMNHTDEEKQYKVSADYQMAAGRTAGHLAPFEAQILERSYTSER